MKKILPLTLWIAGKNVTATVIFLLCNTDNLKDSAQFYWALYDQMDGNMLVNGNITMTGADYEAWDTNEYAWNWAASSLGVTFDTTAPVQDAPAMKKGKKS